jgi:hypothetical protein
MEKYITREIPRASGVHWWVPECAPKIIEMLELANPHYEFVQFVTSPGNGGYKEYAILRLMPIENYKETDETRMS